MRHRSQRHRLPGRLGARHCLRSDQQVTAKATSQFVVTGITKDLVVHVAGEDDIVAPPPHDRVGADSNIREFPSILPWVCVAARGVVRPVTYQEITSSTTVHVAIAVTTSGGVGAVAKNDSIIFGTCQHGIVAGATEYSIVTVVTENTVVAVAAVEVIAIITTKKNVVAHTPKISSLPSSSQMTSLKFVSESGNLSSLVTVTAFKS